MRQVVLLALGVFLVLAVGRGQASEITRAYFRVRDPRAAQLISKYMHHDFGEGVFSLELPRVAIEALAKHPGLEFRGEASLWKIDKHQTVSTSCSPAAAIPWGVAKVNGGSGGTGVKVAVLDTGVYVNHPDLKANIVGCIDAQTSSLRKRCADGNGHGTHVAGTVAANGKIVGVAPQAKIMVIKVCSNSGWCWSDDVARGVRWASDNGAGVINLSLGGSAITTDEKNAIDYAVGKGVLVVAAAGNSGPAVNSINYPAAYAPVVAVGAIDSSDQIAGWSSRGNNYATTPYTIEERDIEFAAPGVSVESTAKNGCYATYSGTSMATPHVAGLAAKLWQASPSATRSYLQDRARNNYADLGQPGDDPDAGFGLPTAP